MPSVFISYSHDSQEHKEWVLRFAHRLNGDGIDVRIDQKESQPAGGLPKWMVQQIEESDFVIAVCTEGYLQGARGGATGGKGVGWETMLIYQQIYNSGSRNTRVIPVLPPGGSPATIPLPLQPVRYYRPEQPSDYEALRSRLLGMGDEGSSTTSLVPNPRLGPDATSSQSYLIREVPGFGKRFPRNIAALNDAGQIAGDSHVAGGMSHAFWQGVDLILPGDEHSFAYDLNDAGWVVGVSAKAGGPVRAFVYRDGQIEDLSNLAGNPSVAYGVNNLGVVVGSAYLGGRFDAFSLEGGTLRLLGTPHGSPAKRVADSGFIAGDGWVYENGSLTSFDWGSYVSAYDLNNRGEVVGQAAQRPQEGRAFLYRGGKMIDLGHLGGAFSRAVGINDRSEIVGYSTDSNGSPRAFVCCNGQIRDLNSLVESSNGWLLEVASAINNRGQIAGSGRLHGHFRAFVLDPLL